MFNKLFILFALLPIAEIALIIEASDRIGGWNTFGLVILTAILGAHLVRQQGIQTMMQAQQQLQSGQIPGQQMAEGLLLVIAGILLVTPGFITDLFGLMCCLPGTRKPIAKLLMSRLSVSVAGQTTPGGFYQYQQSSAQSDIIEGEFEHKDDKLKPRLRKPD